MSRVDQAEAVESDAAQPRFRPTRGIYIVAGIAVLMFLLGMAGGGQQSKLADVQKNDQSAYLPNTAESTKVANESEKFQPVQTIPGFIVYHRDSGLTAEDKAKIAADVNAFRKIDGVAADQVGPPIFSTKNDTTAATAVPLIGKSDGVSKNGNELSATEKDVIAAAREGAPAGLVVHSAGPGGLLVAFVDSFNGIDGALLLAAGLVVIVILLVVYRSPILWFFPLFSAVMALGTTALFIYPLAKHDVLTLNGQTQGIMSVLVIGAGTDYALLLISRYREELHTYTSDLQAMSRAWRGAAPPILASGATVMIGLMCMGFGELNSDRSLGPVCAIAIGCTVATMLTFLPAFILVIGRYGLWFVPIVGWILIAVRYRRYHRLNERWIFWPRVPKPDHKADIATHGMWGRFAAALGRHPRRSWIASTAALLVCVLGVLSLRTAGLTITASFTSNPDAIVGQKLFDASFDQGAGAPAIITASAASSDEIIAAVSKVAGVVSGPGAVCVATDFNKVAALAKAGQLPAGFGGAECVPPALQVQPINGRIMINAGLVDRYDTAAASATVQRIRGVVHPIAGAEALVGGSTAINYDTQQASRHDRNLIIPIVLVVILVVLALLLRALVVPVLLVATVVLSFLATLGVCAVVFNHVFNFANSDPAFPLFAFVFLVALGIDYNIFLMTRVREETLKHGTRDGILRGLAVTGGVITSAGVVLAATFVVLGVLPLVFLAELGFAVAFGVLLDTILVRSILVPALSYDIGRAIWWPSKLARAQE